MQIITKRIYLKNAYNVRDLGGFLAGEGKGYVKWNLLFRSDSLASLDKGDWDLLIERGVRTILDLRSASEVKLHHYKTPEGITYRNCPLQREEIDLNNPIVSAQKAFEKSLLNGYRNMVEECTDLLVKALEEVMEGLKKGAVLFHCSAGKDRTGVLAAVLLCLLGVLEEDIIADYQVSYTYNQKGINQMLKGIKEAEIMRPFLLSNAENMEDLISSFKQDNHLESLLEKAGFLKEQIEKLRSAAIIQS